MDVPAPNRILLVRLSHLGDVVHALPVFHALHAAHPQAALAWAVQGEFAGLLQGLEGLSRTFLFDRRGGIGAWRRLRRELLSWGPDLAVDAQGNLKSAAVTFLSGARVRLGPARQDWREPFGARVLTHRAPPATGVHAVHRMLALVEPLAPGRDPCFDLSLSAAERAAGRRDLERLPDRGGRRWILHLSPEGDRRAWPAERFARLARHLAGGSGGVLVVSGPAEAPAGRRLEGERPSLEGLAHWVGQSGLRRLAGLLLAGAEEGVRFVGCDSGPGHLAAACGMGVDLLSGPQDPQRTGPWPPPGERGSTHRVLRAAEGRLAPMQDLSVEAVAAALGEGGGGADG